ncbi:MAG: TetR family transcriptional regulator [bacterium]|nr:TetR family transcriptional regulator [bacterium]
MPPKTVFTREDIISAAFEIVKKGGFKDLSARKVADQLNSSTAPVYSYFSSMDDLKTEILSKAEAIMLEYSMRPYTSSVFLNMGTGLSLFSRDNKELFRALLLESNDSKEMLKNFLKSLAKELDRDELMSQLSGKYRQEVLERMAIFAQGLASLICAGMIDNVDKKFIISTMYEIGKDVIDVALIKSGKKPGGAANAAPE